MHAHAAFTAADVEDARRGRPATDLSRYGQSRGLEPLGQALVGHVAGLNPLWSDHVFNVLRGELGDGRFGTIQHELHEVPLGDDGQPGRPGEYHGRRSVGRSRWIVPGWLRREPPNEPFAAQAMWVPTTGVKVLVPEAALLPRTLVTSAAHAPLLDPRLEPQAPSFRLQPNRFASTELVQVLAASVGPTLESLGDTFVRLELAHGALGLTVDGYRADPVDLDRLVTATLAMAAALAQVARPWWLPAPFEAPLGPFEPATHPAGYRSFATDLDRSGLDALERDAAALGLVVEDPVALHRRFPRLPLPGTSMGVLAGPLPGRGALGRLTWQTQSHPGSTRYLRRAAVVAARPDAPASPVGGRLVTATDMYAAAVDGVACCWTRGNSEGRLDAADLAERAVATLGAAELADV